MSRSEDEERRPLVYEDRVGSIEDEAGRRRRKYMCVALTTVCLGVGLALAVALPLTMSQGKTSSNSEVPVAFNLQISPSSDAYTGDMTYTEKGEFFTEPTADETGDPSQRPTLVNDPETSSSDETVSSSASSTRFPFRPTSWTFPFSHRTTIFPPRSTILPPDPHASCPTIPQGRRGPIDLAQLNGKMLFELYRIQTPNSPAYVDEISCSVTELDLPKAGNDSGTKNSSSGKMKLSWMEYHVFSRYPRKSEVKLEAISGSPNDFKESFGDQSNDTGKLSLLMELDGLLLAYECFPNVSYYPRPGYVIHVYSFLPWKDESYLAKAMLDLANIWGLNPAEESIVRIKHFACPQEY